MMWLRDGGNGIVDTIGVRSPLQLAVPEGGLYVTATSQICLVYKNNARLSRGVCQEVPCVSS